MKKKIVLAYSGGLDTSVILKWLQITYDADIIAYIGDVGQGDVKDAIKKANKTGAYKTVVVDLKEEFVRDYVFQAIKAGAVYEGRYLLGTSLARPVIAKYQVLTAKKEKAFAVSHGATGKGNDQVRFEMTFKTLGPDLKIIAPWRDWEFKSRTDLINFAKKHGIEVSVTKKKPYSSDLNVMHISYEGGILEDSWREPDESMFEMTKSVSKAKKKPLDLVINFEKGIPVGINNKNYSPYKLLLKMNELAGEYGIGRIDIVENRLVGIKSRGVYETPGATVLFEAHRDLEGIILDKRTMHYKSMISLEYANLVYNGEWFTPLKEAMDAFIDHTQKNITGDVRVRFYPGGFSITGRCSENSLYSEDYATFEEDEVYNQKDAEGFINLFGLQAKIGAMINKKKK